MEIGGKGWMFWNKSVGWTTQKLLDLKYGFHSARISSHDCCEEKNGVFIYHYTDEKWRGMWVALHSGGSNGQLGLSDLLTKLMRLKTDPHLEKRIQHHMRHIVFAEVNMDTTLRMSKVKLWSELSQHIDTVQFQFKNITMDNVVMVF